MRSRRRSSRVRARPNIENVYGLLSLISWVLVLIVSVKYVAFILRADNRGEGGVLALLALILQQQHRAGEARAEAARSRSDFSVGHFSTATA